jgi:hypothetical protein
VNVDGLATALEVRLEKGARVARTLVDAPHRLWPRAVSRVEAPAELIAEHGDRSVPTPQVPPPLTLPAADAGRALPEAAEQANAFAARTEERETKVEVELAAPAVDKNGLLAGDGTQPRVFAPSGGAVPAAVKKVRAAVNKAAAWERAKGDEETGQWRAFGRAQLDFEKRATVREAAADIPPCLKDLQEALGWEGTVDAVAYRHTPPAALLRRAEITGFVDVVTAGRGTTRVVAEGAA